MKLPANPPPSPFKACRRVNPDRTNIVFPFIHKALLNKNGAPTHEAVAANDYPGIGQARSCQRFYQSILRHAWMTPARCGRRFQIVSPAKSGGVPPNPGLSRYPATERRFHRAEGVACLCHANATLPPMVILSCPSIGHSIHNHSDTRCFVSLDKAALGGDRANLFDRRETFNPRGKRLTSGCSSFFFRERLH